MANRVIMNYGAHGPFAHEYGFQCDECTKIGYVIAGGMPDAVKHLQSVCGGKVELYPGPKGYFKRWTCELHA